MKFVGWFILIPVILLLPGTPTASGQEAIRLDTSNQQFLTPEEFNRTILRYHPMAKRANLEMRKGPAKVRKTRGNFDPQIYSDWNAKEFKGKTYYRVRKTGLKIPTWFGIDLKFYQEQNRGKFLNEERTVPSDGLYGIGIEMPVGQGLFINKRRTALNKAKVMREVQVNKQHQLLMKLLSKGFRDYWKWGMLHQQEALMQEAANTARQRFLDIKRSYRGGESTAIDTVEALSQWQQYQVRQRSLNGKLEQQRAKISTYLWDEQANPRKLTGKLQPPPLTSFSTATLENLVSQARRMDSVSKNHPALTQYRNKLELLSLDNQWQKEQLKPKLDLKYHALQDAGKAIDVQEQSLNDDIKWGIGFSFPLFLREERGNLRLTKLKRQSTQLALKEQQLTLQRQLEGAQNRLNELLKLIKTNRANLANYKRLLEAEKTLYEAGESSLLKINLRELNYLKAKQKQVKFFGRFFQLYSRLRYQYTYQRNLAYTQEDQP